TTPGLTLLVYLLLLRPPPTSTLFPYTTLFRSAVDQRQPEGDQKQPRRVHQAVHGNDGDEFRHTRLLRPRAPRRAPRAARRKAARSEEHTSELQSRENLVCRLLLEKKKKLYMKK